MAAQASYTVIELINGNIDSNSWRYDTKADAETKYFQVLSEVVQSPVASHTAMLVADDGFVLENRHYDHTEEA